MRRGAASRRRAHRRGRHEPTRSAARELRSGARRGREPIAPDLDGTWADALGIDEGPAFYLAPEEPDR